WAQKSAARNGNSITDLHFHDRMNFPNSKVPIRNRIGWCESSGWRDQRRKSSSNHGHDWMSRHAHLISVARKKGESCVCPREHTRAKFAPRAADRKFDDDSSASAIGISHDNVKVAVVFHLNVDNSASYGVPV